MDTFGRNIIMKKLVLFIVVLFCSLEGFSQVADKKVFGKLTVIDTIIAESGLQFVPTSGISHSEGLIFYDSITNTFSGFIDRTNVTLNIGEENWLRIVNKSGVALSNGQAVYINGAQGNRPTILMAKADALSTSQGTIAVLTEDIADNDEGIATTFGLVRSFNTTGFTAGDELFLSATNAGGIVNVKPTAPDFVIRIGWALNSTVNGAILVNISVYGDGSNNTFIDQDVTTTGSPTFSTATISNNILISGDTLFNGTDTATITEIAINRRSYADLHASDSSVTLSMTQNNYVHITNPSNTLLTAGHAKNITTGGDSLIVTIAGTYRVDVHISLNGNANDIYEGVIAIGNVINNDHKVTRKTSNNDVGDMSFSGLYIFTASQSVKMMLRNTANNNDAIIVNACLVMNRIDK